MPPTDIQQLLPPCEQLRTFVETDAVIITLINDTVKVVDSLITVAVLLSQFDT